MEHEPDDEPPKLSGQAVRDLSWAFRQTLGDEVVDAGFAAAPAAAREAYTTASPLSWVAYADVLAVHEALAEAGHTTMEAMLDEAVPLAVEHAFKTVWRILLRMTGDAALVKRTPLIYSKSRSKGEMTASIEGPGRAVAEVRGWAKMPPRDIRSLGLSIETMLRIAGREGVVAIGRPTADGAHFEVRWRR